MRFFKYVIALALAAAMSLPLLAQQSESDRLNDIVKAAGLTAEQQAQVKAIMQKSMDDLAALRKAETTYNDTVIAKLGKLWATEHDSILAVLTAEQKPKYEAYYKSWQDDRAKDKH
jgi:hypothetical protein